MRLRKSHFVSCFRVLGEKRKVMLREKGRARWEEAKAPSHQLPSHQPYQLLRDLLFTRPSYKIRLGAKNSRSHRRNVADAYASCESHPIEMTIRSRARERTSREYTRDQVIRSVLADLSYAAAPARKSVAAAACKPSSSLYNTVHTMDSTIEHLLIRVILVNE